jgi:hypothetical protein
MKKLLIILSVLVLLALWYAQARHFYKFSDGTTLTFWKTIGGRCYIIPGIYLSPFRPKNNYVSTSNVNLVHIVRDKKTPFDFIIASAFNEHRSTIIKLSNYSIKYYSPSKWNEFETVYMAYTPQNKGAEHLSVDIREMTASLGVNMK